MLKRISTASLLLALLFAPTGVRGEDDPIAPGGRFDAPAWVMLRSALVPGWGQAKNGEWLKVLLAVGLEATFAERLRFEHCMVQRYEQRLLWAEVRGAGAIERDQLRWRVEKHENHRRDFIWWTSMLVVLSMGDAFVDAHLKGFDVRLQAEPAGGEAAPEESGVRLGLVYQF